MRHSRTARWSFPIKALGLVVALWTVAPGRQAFGQATTRQLLSSGTGAPGHSGFVFGPFSDLAMNEADDIVFLSSLRSARIDLRAVVRSKGVSFSVVAFQGLRSPVPRATYDSFSAPSINAAGIIAFTAQLKDEVPVSAVIRVEGGNSRAVVTSGDPVPAVADTTFQEFSAPLVNSAGNILFGARATGKNPMTGLFLWTPAGIQSVAVPPPLYLTPNDLLQPVYFSHDEAVFIPRGTSADLAIEQFFRAVAAKTFQELNPQPQPAETVELLDARPADPPAKMLLVSMEGGSIQTVPLVGDPAKPVMTRQQPGAPLKPLLRIAGQTGGARGNIILAATTAGQESDFALYCLCEGQVVRLTPPEEFLPILVGARGRFILSFAGDSQEAVAFIAPVGQGADTTAIYITPLPE